MPNELKRYVGLLDNDSSVLQSLKSWQKQAIMLHLEGHSGKAISEQLNKSPQSIRKFLDSPPAKELISDYYRFLDSEFKSLYSQALSSMRACMDESAPLDTRRKAAEFVLKNLGHNQGTSVEEDSAEGIIQRVLNQYNVYVDQRGSGGSEVSGNENPSISVPSSRIPLTKGGDNE